MEKLEIETINKIKELKELETTKKELEELEKEKTNETIVNIPREILLTHFLRHGCQLIKQVNENKVSEKRVRTVEIIKDAIIK